MKSSNRTFLNVIPFISLGFSVLFLIISITIKDIPEKQKYIYKDNQIIPISWHNTFEFCGNLLLITILIFSVVMTIICIINRIKNKDRIRKYIVLIWITEFVCFFIILFSDIIVTGLTSKHEFSPECYQFSNGKHTIVIEEESYLLYGGGTVYQIIGDNEAVYLIGFSTDDGARNNGNYNIIWHDDYAEIASEQFASIKAEFID